MMILALKQTGDFVFAKPIIRVVMNEEAAAVRIDVNSFVVEPKCA